MLGRKDKQDSNWCSAMGLHCCRQRLNPLYHSAHPRLGCWGNGPFRGAWWEEVGLGAPSQQWVNAVCRHMAVWAPSPCRHPSLFLAHTHAGFLVASATVRHSQSPAGAEGLASQQAHQPSRVFLRSGALCCNSTHVTEAQSKHTPATRPCCTLMCLRTFQSGTKTFSSSVKPL